MNQNNFDYLKNQLKYTGFGDSLEFQLQDKMKTGAAEFQLTFKPEYGQGKAEATAYFRKSDTQDNYFFNKYDLAVAQDKGDTLKQTFHIGKDNNYTVKEGFNLLEGRAVHKALVNQKQEAYQSWVKLDFSDTTNGGNFKMRHFADYDLQAALSKLPLKTNSEDTRQQILDSLEKGNRQAVTFIHKGEDHKRFLEAAPQFKTINVFDGNQRVRNETLQQTGENTQGNDVSKESKQSAKNTTAAGEDSPAAPEAKQRNSRKKSQGVS